MRRNAKWMTGSLAICLGMLGLALPATAGVDDFTLTRAIPADAAMVVHTRDHAGMAFLNKQYERVWKVAEKQHFERDLRTLLKGLYTEQGGDVEEFDQQWQQFNDLLLGVEWSSLAQREFAFAMKLDFPAPEFVCLFLSSPEKAEKNFTGLAAIAKTLVGFVPEGALVLSTQGEGDSVVLTVGIANAPVPLGLMLAREKDVLLLGFGQTMPEQALALLRGEPGKTLASSERFQTVLQKLPPPTDSLFFMDVARWIGQVRAVVNSGMSMADPTGEALDPKMKALPGKIFDAMDVFEYLAVVSTTDGLKTTCDNIVLLRADAQSKPLYDIIYGNGTLKEPLKFIPQEAQNFSVWSGFSPRALYDAIITFIRDEVPDGEGLLAQWQEAQEELKEQFDLDIEKDILDWIGGGIATFSLPAKSAYGAPESVLMLSVKDEAKASEMLGRLLEELEPLLEKQQGIISDAKIAGAEDFKVIGHPMLAMVPGLGQPTLGVKHGQLFLGSSPKAVAAALATAAGESPNFATNERFLREGLPLESNVASLGFTDLTKIGEEWGQILQMLPMIGMFVPQVVQNPVGKAALSAASKLGKVVRELNFFQSSCTQTTFDGQVMYTKAITNYREPPQPGTKTPAEPEESGQTEEPGKAGMPDPAEGSGGPPL